MNRWPFSELARGPGWASCEEKSTIKLRPPLPLPVACLPVAAVTTWLAQTPFTLLFLHVLFGLALQQQVCSVVVYLLACDMLAMCYVRPAVKVL